MSILMEIAEKAEVSVEGVVRVLTREPVSDAIQERVLAVLDDLGPEQTRAVQRFALAALQDVLPRAVEPRDVLDAPPAHEVAPGAGHSSPVVAPEESPVLRPDAALVQLRSVLGELAEAVRDLRHETAAERRERVDDLAVLIDLITTGWQGLDGRLGRLERQLSRLEPGGQPSGLRHERVDPWPALAPVRAEPPPVEPEAIVTSPPPPVASSTTILDPGTRDRLPLAAALTMVGVLIGVVAVLQLFSGGPDVAGVVAARDTTTETAGGNETTTARATNGARTRPAATSPRPAATTPAPTASATTSSVLGTSVAETQPSRTVTTPKPTPAPAPAATTKPATTAATPTGFRPTRNWAWAPVAGADYYDVEFSRDGESFYRASPAEARLTLPSALVFRPGSYRWVVRPGFGERSAKKLGAPVVDSPFTVAG